MKKRIETKLRWNPKWIPMSEKQPEWLQDCLVVRSDGKIHIAPYYSDGFCLPEEWLPVSHWMPLPPVPKK